MWLHRTSNLRHNRFAIGNSLKCLQNGSSRLKCRTSLKMAASPLGSWVSSPESKSSNKRLQSHKCVSCFQFLLLQLHFCFMLFWCERKSSIWALFQCQRTDIKVTDGVIFWFDWLPCMPHGFVSHSVRQMWVWATVRHFMCLVIDWRPVQQSAFWPTSSTSLGWIKDSYHTVFSP